MGSAKVPTTPQIPTMADHPIKKILKSLELFKKFKKTKKKDEPPKEEAPDTKPIAVQAIDKVLERIQKLDLKEVEQEDEDELRNFSCKTVEDARTDRSESHSSEDSGISTKFVEDDEKVADGKDDRDEYEADDDDVIEALDNLSIGDRKKLRQKKVLLNRAPLRNKIDVCKQTRPYPSLQQEASRQVQINRNTFTGGQVIVKTNDSFEFDNALKQVQKSSQYSQHEHGRDWLNIVTEYIEEESSLKAQNTEDLLSEFLKSAECAIPNNPIMTPPHQPLEKVREVNPIEEFSYHVQYETFGDVDLTLNDYVDTPPQHYTLTPPHSENASSPMSDSQSRNSDFTYSPGNSNTLSPERSSPIYNSDYEKFQELGPYEDYPGADEPVCRERKDSTSSACMTMKQYKDLQKELSLSFSKKDCCQMTRKPCKQTFVEHLQKLKAEDRKDICFKVAKLDLKYAYAVLQNIIISLSKTADLEDLQYSLFMLIVQRVLSQEPAWFVGDFGLNLLKSSALRCPHRSIITRFVVHCIRTAIRLDPALAQGKESVFHEVDALGDTLLIACTRRGDACADVLAEISRVEPNQPPLFRVNHVNAEGTSALHVACSEHSSSTPMIHCTHVLLEHAGADLWLGDNRGRDTALHMAVNSRTCDLRLVMVMFRHLDRKSWKKLAHMNNGCVKSPLDYARAAVKTQTLPPEVLDFLKKCR